MSEETNIGVGFVLFDPYQDEEGRSLSMWSIFPDHHQTGDNEIYYKVEGSNEKQFLKEQLSGEHLLTSYNENVPTEDQFSDFVATFKASALSQATDAEVADDIDEVKRRINEFVDTASYLRKNGVNVVYGFVGDGGPHEGYGLPIFSIRAGRG
ncbi:hypothetical protein OAH97_01100 [Octadecabacter sp.]|nr:hypothetical protein [Octadecabacter sp.]